MRCQRSHVRRCGRITRVPDDVCYPVLSVWVRHISDELRQIPLFLSPTIDATRVLVVKKSSQLKAGVPRRVIVVAVPPVEELDLIGPLQVFSSANRLALRAIYSLEVVTPADDLEIPGEGGLCRFLANGRLRDVKGSFDSTLLVCGVASRNARDPILSEWLRETVRSVRRVGAVCVGAFLLAEAGLLDGKRATAHWKFGRELAKRYPQVRVEPDPLWVKDGNVYTSAGISAGIDLALAWVEEDCGTGLAHEAARELVLFLRRPAGQRQLSVSLCAQAAEMKSIQELQIWIAEHLRDKLSVRVLAERAYMSARNFQRVFTREVGRTPSQYVLEMRVEAARRQLELTDRSMKEVAAAVGFNSVDLFRRSFRRVLGLTPGRYCLTLKRLPGEIGHVVDVVRRLSQGRGSSYR